MGGNIRLPIKYIIYVDTEGYLQLSEQNKYSVARLIGMLNAKIKGSSTMLIGPGRWGTTTPSLGVPVNFSEICNMSVICEVASKEAGFMPELSYGSHFFQDLVESDIFYIAIFNGEKDVIYHPYFVTAQENKLAEILPEHKGLIEVIHVVETKDLVVYSDILSQTLICL